MTEFKLSKQTVSIIDNFSKIFDSAIFRPGKLISVVSKDRDVAAFAEVEDIFPDRFAIGSLSKFLSVLSLYEDPTLSVKDGQLIIKGAGARKFALTLASEKQIPSTEKDIKTFLKQFGEPAANFSLEGADLLAIKKNMNAAQLPTVSFTTLKNSIVVKASDTTNPTSDVFEMTLKTKSDKPFNMMFADRKIHNMFEKTYEISVFKPMVRFASRHNDVAVEYFNAPERGSKVND